MDSTLVEKLVTNGSIGGALVILVYWIVNYLGKSFTDTLVNQRTDFLSALEKQRGDFLQEIKDVRDFCRINLPKAIPLLVLLFIGSGCTLATYQDSTHKVLVSKLGVDTQIGNLSANTAEGDALTLSNLTETQQLAQIVSTIVPLLVKQNGGVTSTTSFPNGTTNVHPNTTVSVATPTLKTPTTKPATQPTTQPTQ